VTRDKQRGTARRIEALKNDRENERPRVVISLDFP